MNDIEIFLQNELCIENCLKIYSTAIDVGSQVLLSPARTYSIWRFTDIIKTEQFLNLTLKGN